MLSTNEIESIGNAVGTAVGGAVSEIVSGVLLVLIPFLIKFWRQSRIKSAIIDVLVRGINKSSDQIGDGETQFVKKTVKQEASNAGIEKHVEKAVKDVTDKMEEEKNPPVNS